MTFDQLKQSVQYETKRQTFYDPAGNDVTDFALGLFVNASVRSLQRLLPVRDAETSAIITTGPVGDPSYPFIIANLPTPYRFTEAIFLLSAAAPPLTQRRQPLLRYQTYREFRTVYPFSAGIVNPAIPTFPPGGYVLVDGNLYVGPDPLMFPVNLLWIYTRWLDDLSSTNETNWYTDNAEQALLYGACREAAVWLQEEPLIQMYQSMTDKAFTEVRGSLVRHEETSEGDLKVELYG